MSNNFTTSLEELFVRYHTQAQALRMLSKGWHIQNIDKKQIYKIKTFQRKDVKMATSYQMHYCRRHEVNIWNGKMKKSLIVFLKACLHHFKKMWFQQDIWIKIQWFFKPWAAFVAKTRHANCAIRLSYRLFPATFLHVYFLRLIGEVKFNSLFRILSQSRTKAFQPTGKYLKAEAVLER